MIATLLIGILIGSAGVVALLVLADVVREYKDTPAPQPQGGAAEPDLLADQPVEVLAASEIRRRFAQQVTAPRQGWLA